MSLAIIDIGSNAIRAVVYDSNTLGASEIFNAKFKSDLLNLLKLDDIDVKSQVYLSLQHLMHVFKQLSVNHIKCVATAVLRNQPRALEFQNIVKQKFNIDIEIISGLQEATFSAMGLISSVDDAEGLVADLGGGSLELAEVSGKSVQQVTSLDLGTKVIVKNNIKEISVIVDILKAVNLNNSYSNLYLIGGAFRFIARSYIEYIRSYIKVIHNFEIEALDLKLYLQKLHSAPKHLLYIDDSRKIDFNAVLVIEALLSAFTPNKIIISNYGLKEGVRFVALPKSEQNKNMVYERVKKILDIKEYALCNFDKYKSILSSVLLKSCTMILNMVDFTFMILQFARNIDKNLIMECVEKLLLISDIPFKHKQRLMLIIIIASAYQLKVSANVMKLSKYLLTKNDYKNCQILGYFCCIAIKIDGPIFINPSFNLVINAGHVKVVTQNILPRVIFHQVCQCIKEIAIIRRAF